MGSSHPRISSRRREDWGTSHTLLLRSCQNSIFIDQFCNFAVLPYLGLCKVKKFVILINGTRLIQLVRIPNVASRSRGVTGTRQTPRKTARAFWTGAA